MKLTIWTDPSGRRWRRGIPDGAPDREAEYGVPAGPPDLEDLVLAAGWPENLAIALHNQLADRELWDAEALKRKGGHKALMPAILGALRIDAGQIAAAYADTG